MKTTYKTFLGTLAVAGLSLLLNACVVDGTVREGVYYGPHRDPWFHDDAGMDGRRGYWGEPGPAVNGYIHPPRGRR